MDELKELNIDSIISSKKWSVTWKGNPLKSGTLNVVPSPRTSKVATLALEFLINRDGMRCSRCGRCDYLTVDHIIPISLLENFGQNRDDTYRDWENLHILCKLCNAFKKNNLDFSDPRTKPLLVKYVNQISELPAKE